MTFSLPNNFSKDDRFGLIFVILSSILLGIWAVKNTIALRNIILVFGSILGLIYIVSQLKDKFLKDFITFKNCLPLIMVSLIFFWIVFHYLFLSRYPQEQFQELSSTWLRSFLAAIMAIATAIAISKKKIRIYWLWAGIFISFLYLFFQYLPKAWATQSLLAIDWYGNSYIFHGKINGVLAGSIMIAGLAGCSLSLFNFKSHPKKVFVSFFWLAGLFLAIYCYVFVFDARNGIGLAMIILFLVPGWLLLCIITKQQDSKSSIPLKNFFIVFILAITLIVWFGKEQSERNPGWRTIIEDVQIAVQIDKYPNWQDPQQYGYPKTADNRQVVFNNYERTAWTTAGLTLFAPENPLGIGVMSRSFPRLLKQKYGKNVDYIPSTHSAWVDLTLSYGFVGLFLLLGSLLIIIVRTILIPSKPANFTPFNFIMASSLVFIYTVAEVSVQHGIEMLIYWITFLASLDFIKQASKDSLKLS
jgi:hypothetical protein